MREIMKRGLLIILGVLVCAVLNVPAQGAWAKVFQPGTDAPQDGITSVNTITAPSKQDPQSSVEPESNPTNGNQLGNQLGNDQQSDDQPSNDQLGSEQSSASEPLWTELPPTTDYFVFDQAGLFTQSEWDVLEAKAQELADTYHMGVYFLTTDFMNGLYNPTSSQRTQYAVNFYKSQHLGLGAGKDGIMFVIAAVSRDYVTIAYGQGSYSFSDEGIEFMEDAVKEELSDNNWYEAACVYYDQIGSQLSYYEKHGKPGHPLSVGDWILRLCIILIIPFIVAAIIVLMQARAMKPVKQRVEANDYLDPSSVAITAAEDSFITTTLVTTPRASSSSSSGGGGGWGGGGGGGFSSSGGGKF